MVTLLGGYVKQRRSTVWSGGLVQILGEFGFSPGAARVALTRMVHRDLLARVKDGRLVHYALTPRSRELLSEGDQRIFSVGRRTRGVEQWTVLWQTIPDARRLDQARLIRRLRFLGFASLQDGTWISPHDRESEVAMVVSSLKLHAHVAMLLGRPAGSVDFAAFARRAWDLDAVAARYEAFADEFAPLVPSPVRGQLSDYECFILRTRLVHMFRAFPALDPDLPEELMPRPGCRAAAVAAFDLLYSALAAPAQRYFDRVTSINGAPSLS